MSTQTHTAVHADLQSLCDAIAEGAKPDAELVKRVDERAEKVGREVFEKQGVLDIAGDLIRETRDE